MNWSSALVSVRRWRLRSRTAALLDLATAAAGVALIAATATDSLMTWPSDTIWVSPTRLEGAVPWQMIPWAWLLFSMVVVFLGTRELPRIGRLPTAALATLAAFCLTVIVGGAIIGGTKGSFRVLPGPRYQVSTPSLNDSEWTTVAPAQFRTLQARVIRQDAMLTIFGVILVGGPMFLARARRQSGEAS